MLNNELTAEAIFRLNDIASANDISRNDFLVLPAPDGTIRLPLKASARTRNDLLTEYWTFHPRYRFLKTARRNSTLADFGAGSGGLIFWRNWGTPLRDDLSMYALDINKGRHFDQYNGFDVADLNSGHTTFLDGAFDYVILSHVVEHITDHSKMFDEIARVCALGASIYIEWPHPRSSGFVKRSVLAKLGISASTINFFDDPTHLRPISASEVCQSLESRGFQIREQGDIKNDYIADEMFSYAYNSNDSEIMTYALWLSLGFSQYVTVERREQA